jgi:hypothetical protein
MVCGNLLQQVLQAMSRTPFTVEQKQHAIRRVSLRTFDVKGFDASGCAARRADGVPAFLA